MDDLTLAPDDELAPTGWSIESISDAEFAFRCINESQAEIDEVDAQRQHLINEIERRVQSITAKAQRRVAFFTSALAVFAERNKKDLLIGTRKSRELIAGTFAWRKKGGKAVVTDREALVAWLAEQPDTSLMRVKIEPDMKALQDLIAKTGVIPPGMDVEPEHDSLTITPTLLPVLNGATKKELT